MSPIDQICYYLAKPAIHVDQLFELNISAALVTYWFTFSPSATMLAAALDSSPFQALITSQVAVALDLCSKNVNTMVTSRIGLDSTVYPPVPPEFISPPESVNNRYAVVGGCDIREPMHCGGQKHCNELFVTIAQRTGTPLVGFTRYSQSDKSTTSVMSAFAARYDRPKPLADPY